MTAPNEDPGSRVFGSGLRGALLLRPERRAGHSLRGERVRELLPRRGVERVHGAAAVVRDLLRLARRGGLALLRVLVLGQPRARALRVLLLLGVVVVVVR